MRFLRFLAILSILILGFFVWFHSALQPMNTSDGVLQAMEIPKGFSTEQIGELLKERGVIRSSLAFRWYAKWRGLENKLRAGSFVLGPSQTIGDVLSSLTNSTDRQMSITIPEGYTVSQIDGLLAQRGLIEPDQFAACARTCDLSNFPFLPTRSGLSNRGGKVEGFVFPDTYFVTASGFSAEVFLHRLLDTFEERVIDGLKSEIVASKKSIHDIVTMASLIEEEAAADDERPMISGILWKREAAPMSLGVDAAVRYILNKPSVEITVADLAIDSPYNLRKHPGLPPGPIANPGMASIRAAISPQQSPYWYYLHGIDGRIHYAETNEQHNENKRRYL